MGKLKLEIDVQRNELSDLRKMNESLQLEIIKLKKKIDNNQRNSEERKNILFLEDMNDKKDEMIEKVGLD
jgi:hypothetical protein